MSGMLRNCSDSLSFFKNYKSYGVVKTGEARSPCTIARNFSLNYRNYYYSQKFKNYNNENLIKHPVL